MTVELDGSYGEGGGQILRTAVALAAVTGHAVRIDNIRARRPKPGLAPQHVTAVRAAAAVCRAKVEGGEIGSRTLVFAPSGRARAGEYAWDVAQTLRGGSAGSAALVLQTVLLPLALASGESWVQVRGGTHVPWSPSADYLREVWLPTLGRLGCHARIEVPRHGFYPAGGGEIVAMVRGNGAVGRGQLSPLRLSEPGVLRCVQALIVTARLPEHVSRRMSERVRGRLAEGGIDAVDVTCEAVEATSPGASILLVAEYETAFAGFGALGRRGLPAEEVAETAVRGLLAHRASGTALDQHLGDQLVLPLALAAGESLVSIERETSHLRTSAWVVEALGAAHCEIEPRERGGCTLKVRPLG